MTYLALPLLLAGCLVGVLSSDGRTPRLGRAAGKETSPR